MSIRSRGERPEGLVFAAFCLLLLAYQMLFGRFFPAANGRMGHDFSGGLPGLLDGFFWLRNNGPFAPPWFTPSFCGGQPFHADPNQMYYSLPQFLTLVADPVMSSHITMLIFASIGFWGFYLLLRHVFGVSWQAALLGGALFMFNGFFAHRSIIGHSNFHSFPLLPLIAYFLMHPLPEKTASRRLWDLLYAVAGGTLMAYLPQAGMLSLIIPCGLTLALVVSAHLFLGGSAHLVLRRSFIGAVVCAGLSLAKITMSLSLLGHLSRSAYLLPGIRSVHEATGLLLTILFFPSPDMATQAAPILRNVSFLLDRHEFEFGLSIVPLLIAICWLSSLALRRGKGAEAAGTSPIRTRRALLYGAAMAFLVALPLAVNVYTPAWNAFLKTIPIIKSSSSLLRWFFIYIPFVVLVASLLFDRLPLREQHKLGATVAAIIIMLAQNIVTPRDFYENQEYDPSPVVKAYDLVRAGKVEPRIDRIGAYVNDKGQALMVLNRNDLITQGVSQLVCYNPLFGYRLEFFPMRPLHPGSVFDVADGRLNLKDPACYVYPEENNCQPGDHFAVSRREAVEQFVSYRPFPFEIPLKQRLANLTTTATAAAIAAFLLGIGALALFRRFFRRSPP